MSLYTKDMIRKFSARAPRYTSYPTAPQFHDNISETDIEGWLKTILPNEPLSLYIHIPYCDRLCWFCGCHTKHTQRYVPIRRYINHIIAEIALTARKIGRRQPISSLHLGGGSPSLLRKTELDLLRKALDDNFSLASDIEISIEFDPSDFSSDFSSEGDASPLAQDSIVAFIDFGTTRASIGVQDFNPQIQN